LFVNMKIEKGRAAVLVAFALVTAAILQWLKTATFRTRNSETERIDAH